MIILGSCLKLEEDNKEGCHRFCWACFFRNFPVLQILNSISSEHYQSLQALQIPCWLNSRGTSDKRHCQFICCRISVWHSVVPLLCPLEMFPILTGKTFTRIKVDFSVICPGKRQVLWAQNALTHSNVSAHNM